MPPGPGPVQVTPEVAATQLVADVWQGATDGEAEQAMILEVVPYSLMSMEVTELMMVTDVAKGEMPMSSAPSGREAVFPLKEHSLNEALPLLRTNTAPP